MKSFVSVSILAGLILIVLGINILYNPSLLIPIISGVMIVLGVVLLFVGLLLKRVTSFMSGAKMQGMGGMFSQDGIRVIRK